MNGVTVRVFLSNDLHDQLKELAAVRKKSLSGLLRGLLKGAIKRQNAKKGSSTEVRHVPKSKKTGKPVEAPEENDDEELEDELEEIEEEFEDEPISTDPSTWREFEYPEPEEGGTADPEEEKWDED